MMPVKKRIRYIKTLQHLAKKYSATITFTHFYSLGNGYKWYGQFTPESGDTLYSESQNFTEAIRILHMKVRTEI